MRRVLEVWYISYDDAWVSVVVKGWNKILTNKRMPVAIRRSPGTLSQPFAKSCWLFASQV